MRNVPLSKVHACYLCNSSLLYTQSTDLACCGGWFVGKIAATLNYNFKIYFSPSCKMIVKSGDVLYMYMNCNVFNIFYSRTR